MSSKHTNVCIKNINGNLYLYSWNYRRKHLRTARKKQRYEWKYRGPISSKKTQNYISKLPIESQRLIELEIRLKQEEYEKQQEELSKLKKEEPYNSRFNEIMKIANRHRRNKLLKELEKEMKSVI
ncbi:hypothetical protein [Ureibacillus xyleni]|uniref:hypothetical protein n=1 Tax=Ureibacillus xyleni TaxID=614648 RepID=UPI000BE2C401|nr:hypothetical protein [Ureibacillus xyleni]